jgi:uncharacterized protein VirK/YbjX
MLSQHAGLRRGVLSSYGSHGWNVVQRQMRLVGHSDIVEALGAPFNVAPGIVLDLVTFDLGEAPCRITLDQPGWLMRDGALTFSLWEESTRLFSLSITLAEEMGRRIAYVGGIQGMQGDSARERYKQLTKAAHGMRPRDLLFELFRMVCVSIDVKEIRAVSNVRRQRPWTMRLKRAADPATLDYDSIWTDRGGVRGSDGFYVLPSQPAMRSEQEVPARKRGLYRQRRNMLTGLAALMAAAIGSPISLADSEIAHEEVAKIGISARF